MDVNHIKACCQWSANFENNLTAKEAVYMARKRKKNTEEKSTVIKIRDEYDWGRILYDACFIFNKNFAEYLVDYARKYDAGEIVMDDAEKKTGELISQRDRLIGERENLREIARSASAMKVEAFRKYAKSSPIGVAVAQWRRNNPDNDYQRMLDERIKLHDEYRACVRKEKDALKDERKHIDENMYTTRTLNRQVRNITKLVEKHKIPLAHKMQDDVQGLHDLIVSEGQAERLMAVCINILNTYSEKEFITLMNVLDRERIAESIYDFFIGFEHNYDFVSGCYDIDEQTGMLVMKPLDVLANKIYNGYYFTIRGYVQRSYASVRFEKFNVESADFGWESENDNGNHGIDKKAGEESEIIGSGVNPEPEPLDEGMLDMWRDCNAFLMEHLGSMSHELANVLSEKFPRNPYYNNDETEEKMLDVMTSAIRNIDFELADGNVIGSKLKHVVLDAMGGAETNEEWKQNVIVITSIVMKYIRLFFMTQKCRQIERNDDFMEYDND